jgi:hypothetical protein
VRLAALLTGALFVVVIAVMTPYNEMLVRGSRLGLSSLTPAAFFLFFLLVLFINPVFRRFLPLAALNKPELLIIFAMMMVATAIPTRGVTGVMLSMISGPHYYATAENQWADLILPYTKDWIVVGPGDGLRHFYEGVPKRESAIWSSWLKPLLGWLILLLALWTTILSLIVILRRQWMERERLPYPVMQVPLAMAELEPGRAIPPFFRSKAVWAGFVFPFLIGSLDALHVYFPTFPQLFIQAPRLITLRNRVNLRLRLNPLMLGFAYLVNTRLSFSLWVFYLWQEFSSGICDIVGITNNEKLGVWTEDGQVEPIFSHQSMGAMLVFVGFGLWTARDHLRDVFRRARENVDDGREIVRERTALIGLMVGFTVLVGWMSHAGLNLGIATVVVLIALVIFLSLTRAIVDGGLATIVPAMIPLGFTLSAFGTDALGIAGLVALSFTLVWVGDLLSFMMAPVAHAIRIAHDSERESRGPYFGALLGSMVLSLIVSVVVMISLGHAHGAANLHQQYFQGFAKYTADITAQKLQNPTQPHIGGWIWTGVGAAVMGLLTFATYRFSWWPLHPLGYMVSPAWIMASLWFPFLVAWALKSIVIRAGGLRAYDRSRPIAYGVIIGQIVVAGFWLIIDIATGTTGNSIRVY